MHRSFMLLRLLPLLLLLPFSAAAQDGYDVPSNDTGRRFTLSLNGVSNTVYAGRKDSSGVPYISPSVTYHSRTGFYGEGLLAYAASAKDHRIDYALLDAGYEHPVGYVLLGLEADKFFYSANSRNIRADTKGQVTATASCDSFFVAATVEATVLFGSKTDVMLHPALAHEFDFGAHDALDVTPTISCYAGTRRYYESYLRRVRKRLLAKDEVTLPESGKFRMLDYQFSVPVSYQYKTLAFSVTPFYDVPVSPASIVIGGKTYGERLSNTFWVEVMVAWNIRL